MYILFSLIINLQINNSWFELIIGKKIIDHRISREYEIIYMNFQ